MTHPHYIDREAVDVLVAKLRAFAAGCRGSMWQSRDETIRLCDGAADLLETLSRPMEAVSRTEADTSLQKVQTTPSDMEAVAWRWRETGEDAWDYRDDREPKPMGCTVQALAVIPTHGLGSSATPIPTEGQSDSNDHFQAEESK